MRDQKKGMKFADVGKMIGAKWRNLDEVRRDDLVCMNLCCYGTNFSYPGMSLIPYLGIMLLSILNVFACCVIR